MNFSIDARIVVVKVTTFSTVGVLHSHWLRNQLVEFQITSLVNFSSGESLQSSVNKMKSADSVAANTELDSIKPTPMGKPLEEPGVSSKTQAPLGKPLVGVWCPHQSHYTDGKADGGV